ncbi:MAG: glycosyltransferase family 39 protein [Deltaproteobacteria bacterium]|nr:glycosyltransferase family 39 protein [Deltaproteobacteria bacterium]
MSELQAGPRLHAAVLAAALILLCTWLGGVDASAPDEPRYLAVAEEMRSFVHGPEGLVVMHLNGEVYTQKPPLYFWMAAALGAPFGHVSEGLARLPSALAGILCVVLTLLLGSRLFGSAAGVLGAAILLTVYEFGHLGRRVQLDILLAACELAALLAFWWVDRGLGKRRRWVALLHLALGLGVLTKGPVGFLLPVLTIVAFLGWEGRLRDLGRLFPPWALLLSLGPGLLWIAAATSLAPSGFADQAVGTNLFGRFFQGTSHARPFYYFLFQFPIEFLPWTLVWPGVYWVGRHRVFAPKGDPEERSRRAWRFLLAWVGASLVFFSISSGKRGLYMVPAFPAAALLCADTCIRGLAGRTTLPRGGSVIPAAFGLLAFAVGIESIAAGLGHSLVPIETWRLMLPALNGSFLVAFGSGLVGIAAAGAVAWIVLLRNRAPLLAHAAIALGTAFALELAVFALLYPALDPIRSPRPIAVAAAAITPPGEAIGLVGDRALAGGLKYYGNRPVDTLRTTEEASSIASRPSHRSRSSAAHARGGGKSSWSFPPKRRLFPSPAWGFPLPVSGLLRARLRGGPPDTPFHAALRRRNAPKCSVFRRKPAFFNCRREASLANLRAR